MRGAGNHGLRSCKASTDFLGNSQLGAPIPEVVRQAFDRSGSRMRPRALLARGHGRVINMASQAATVALQGTWPTAPARPPCSR